MSQELNLISLASKSYNNVQGTSGRCIVLTAKCLWLYFIQFHKNFNFASCRNVCCSHNHPAQRLPIQPVLPFLPPPLACYKRVIILSFRCWQHAQHLCKPGETGDNWHRCNAKLTLRPIMCIILPLLDAMALRSTTATSSAYQLGTWQWFFTNRIVSPASRKSCLQLSQVSRANNCVCVCVFVNAAEQPNQRRVIRDALCRAVPSIPSSSLAGCLDTCQVRKEAKGTQSQLCQLLLPSDSGHLTAVALICVITTFNPPQTPTACHNKSSSNFLRLGTLCISCSQTVSTWLKLCRKINERKWGY